MTSSISTSTYLFQLRNQEGFFATIDPKDPKRFDLRIEKTQNQIAGIQKQIHFLKENPPKTKARKIKINTYVHDLETELAGKIRIYEKNRERSEPPVVYKQTGLVGNGGFCHILKVQNSQSLNEYALKTPKESDDYPDIVTEWKALSRLKGLKHIVEKTTLFWLEKKPFLLLSLYKSDLTKLLESKGLFSLEDTAILSKQLLDALLSLKEKRIVHRDIKPANIFITQEGIKLGDFGFAVFTKDGLSQNNWGTTDFYSPERLLSQTYGNFSSDLWASACSIAYAYIPELFYLSRSHRTNFAFIQLHQSRLKEQYPNWLIEKLTPGKEQNYVRKIPINLSRSSLEDLIEKAALVKRETSKTGPFKNFLRSLLTLDLRKRSSAKQANKHPFIQEAKKTWDKKFP